MANGHGGKRAGAGRKPGSTRRMRHLLKSLAAEETLLDMVPTALVCLREAAERGDVGAATTILRYSVMPPEKRESLVADLERLRQSDEEQETNDGEA